MNIYNKRCFFTLLRNIEMEYFLLCNVSLLLRHVSCITRHICIHEHMSNPFLCETLFILLQYFFLVSKFLNNLIKFNTDNYFQMIDSIIKVNDTLMIYNQLYNVDYSFNIYLILLYSDQTECDE